VLVPSAGAASELRRTLEKRGATPNVRMPELLTRVEFYDRLHRSSGDLPPQLSAQEREVLLRRAARTVSNAAPPPFSLRPGLIREMLRFYDELRRREQSLDDFSRKVTSQLAYSADMDRGAERLLRQTEFLAAAFAEFERLTNDTGAIDEHGLRTLLLTEGWPGGEDPGKAVPYSHVIVTVADQAADPRGLFATDFDLLARLSGVQRLDVVATENLLASGFHERIHDLLPGLEEERFASGPVNAPALIVPGAAEDDRRWFICRDREEELADVVRDLKQRAASVQEQSRCAVVFQRPLPYLYLARQVFGDAGVSYQSPDALPLSAEPFSAAIDLVLSFLSGEGNRASTIALLSSPHFAFSCSRQAVAALDRRMREVKFSGGWERLAALRITGTAEAALAAAVSAASDLSTVRTAESAAAQLDALLDAVRKFERQPAPEAPWAERHLRARGAVVSAIELLRDAHARHDDEPLTLDELAGNVRRWIDTQTFAPTTGRHGLRLLDAVTAPYADVDELRIVGLVESDWPEPAERRIFYPPAILSQLGWPAAALRSTAARAHFRDLLSLPHVRVSASSFTLEDDAMVAASPFVEELDGAALKVERRPSRSESAVFVHELLASDVPAVEDARLRQGFGGQAGIAEWLALRASRTPAAEGRYQGMTGARPAKTYAVSHVERYLECPFKYYASHVLRLPEERDEEPGLTPQERGHFIHEVFERFFDEWQRDGRQTITTGNVADAIAMFERVVESKLDGLPEADRALERTHLLGSAAASGLAERAFAFEIEQGGEVVERLLEHSLVGTFDFEGSTGHRPVAIRAKADRIDLMADGTLRVIDYKLGRAPKPGRALQLPVYGVCAEQALEGHRGRSWKLERAGYVAFREKDPFVPLGGRSPLTTALKEGQQRFLDAIDAIERGEFPVRPEEPFRCQWCPYAGVCRKDYVGDE
jgi:ATP-dependent helicase/nuclease subunit B